MRYVNWGVVSLGIRTHLFSLAFCYRTTRYIYFITAVIYRPHVCRSFYPPLPSFLASFASCYIHSFIRLRADRAVL